MFSFCGLGLVPHENPGKRNSYIELDISQLIEGSESNGNCNTVRLKVLEMCEWQ